MIHGVIENITINIQITAVETDWILAKESAGTRVIVSVAVIIEPTLGIELASRKSKRVHASVDTSFKATIGIVVIAVHNRPGRIGDRSDGVQMIDLVKEAVTATLHD